MEGYEWIDGLAGASEEFKALLKEKAVETENFRMKRTTKGSPPQSPQFKELNQAIDVDLSSFETVPRLPRRTLAEEVAEELALCEGCTGECPKFLFNQRIVPCLYIEDGREVVRYGLCKFGKQRKLQRTFRSSCIPSRYLGKTFEDYCVDKFNRTAVEFAKNIFALKFGAYFYGKPGAGKTFLASIIAQDFLKSGKSVVFVKVPSLLDDIRATFDGGGDANELAILDALRNSTLVVLDDFGMEKSTQWAGSTLCKILDMRYDNPDAVTIVTSNLSVDELAAHLNNANDGKNINGSRIADRLREICKPILLKGTTRRN